MRTRWAASFDGASRRDTKRFAAAMAAALGPAWKPRVKAYEPGYAMTDYMPLASNGRVTVYAFPAEPRAAANRWRKRRVRFCASVIGTWDDPQGKGFGPRQAYRNLLGCLRARVRFYRAAGA